MKMHFMVSLMGPPFPTLINTHMKNKHQVSVEEVSISENGEELSGVVYNARIRESCRVGDVDKAMKLLAQMEALGFSLSLGSYTTVIEALGSVGRTWKLRPFFMEMVHLGLKPDLRELGGNRATYEALVDYYGHAGRLNDVWAVIGEMSREGFGPDSFVYSKVIGVYRDNGMWKKAMEIVREIREMGVSLDKRIYNSIIDTFGKCGELSEALEVFEKMQEEGVKPDIMTWNSLIQWHCKAGDVGKALELFSKMQEEGLYPDPKIFITIISRLGEQGSGM
ncbi:putative pentatricopeptide repeat-containing protein [Vitis vinifera]|uniref:Putative pentatricopeptide repeat-containing protein n=1 Tax=Vitis vinifera TaxID=29760 RepID=A0A438E248_VITVI|nr:putative pentatricopeptide repeat-containing protein [Vitis vinifera]